MADNTDFYTEGEKNSDGAAAVENNTKIVSEAVNRAVSRYKKQLDERIKRNEAVAALLKEAGLPADITLAAAELIEQNRQYIKNAQSRNVDRECEILGRSDAEDAVENGEWEMWIDLLEKKPTALRNLRDRAFYSCLKEYQRKQEAKAVLEAEGINYEELINDREYMEFVKNLNPELAETEKYNMYLRYTGQTDNGEYSGPEEIPSYSDFNEETYFSHRK